jgi:hypothetical protein
MKHDTGKCLKIQKKNLHIGMFYAQFLLTTNLTPLKIKTFDHDFDP